MPPTPGLPLPPPRPEPKRASVPISAGAFSFSFGPTPKKPRLDPPKQTPRQTPTPSRPARSNAGPSVPRTAREPARETPGKVFRPLDAIPSPLTFLPRPPRSPLTKHETGTPFRRLSEMASPFGQVSPVKKEKKAPAEGMMRLGEVQPVIVKLEDRKDVLVREDEGIGVSPRKERQPKWQDKTTTLAGQLKSVINLNQSNLFYSALHSTLRPASSAHSRSGNRIQETWTPPSALKYITSASIIVQPISTAHGRTHNGVLMRCRLLHAPSKASAPILVSDMEERNGDTARRKLPVGGDPFLDPPADAEDSASEDGGRDPKDEIMDVEDAAAMLPEEPASKVALADLVDSTVMVLFQTLSTSTSRSGIEAQEVVRNLSEKQDKRYRAGIFAPWTEMEVVLPKPSQSGGAVEATSSRRTVIEYELVKVIFAARYLIAENAEGDRVL